MLATLIFTVTTGSHICEHVNVWNRYIGQRRGLGRQGFRAEPSVGLDDGHAMLEPADDIHGVLHEIAACAHWQAVALVLAELVHDTVNAMVGHMT